MADQLCRDATWAWVRIDSIEQALRDSGEMGPGGVQGAGYAVGYAVAGDLLRSGLSVVAECVNPIGLTRAAWRDADLRIDTCAVSPAEAAGLIRSAVRAQAD